MADFDSIWVPRVGTDGARAMRRSASWGLAAIAGTALFFVGLAFVAGSTHSTVGAAFLVVGIVSWAGLVWSRRRLATVLTGRLHIPMRWWDLPPVGHADRFDAWVSRRRGAG